MRLRTLYGGRHLRTTLVLALASGAAGAATGGVLMGVAVSGAPVAHATTPVKHHHRPTARTRRTPSAHTGLLVQHAASTSPSPTRSSPRPSPSKTQPTTPPATTASPQPTGSSAAPTQSPTTAAPGPTNNGQPGTT